MFITLKEFFSQLDGKKVDFGSGPEPISEDFIPFDRYPSKKFPELLVGDYTDESSPVMKSLEGQVSAACCRHSLCCIPRAKAVQSMINIRKTLKPGAPFLLIDFNTSYFLSKLKLILDGASVREVVDSMGPYFKGWYDWVQPHVDYGDGDYSDFLNSVMRGRLGKEVKWRYSERGLLNVLALAGFVNPEIIQIDSPFASPDFTHRRGEEDIVIMSVNQS